MKLCRLGGTCVDTCNDFKLDKFTVLGTKECVNLMGWILNDH